MSADFRAVLAIRQSHGFLHGKSDLFFGVALECVKTSWRHHDAGRAGNFADMHGTPQEHVKQQWPIAHVSMTSILMCSLRNMVP